MSWVIRLSKFSNNSFEQSFKRKHLEVMVLICTVAEEFSNSPAGKGLNSWLSFVVSSCELLLSHLYPGSGVVLDCIDS